MLEKRRERQTDGRQTVTLHFSLVTASVKTEVVLDVINVL